MFSNLLIVVLAGVGNDAKLRKERLMATTKRMLKQKDLKQETSERN